MRFGAGLWLFGQFVERLDEAQARQDPLAGRLVLDLLLG
jgi:hypothetical protein